MYKKIGFIYFSYWRIEADDFLQQCLNDFQEVVFFDLRNLFPELVTDEVNAPFAEDKLPYPPIRFESMKEFKTYLKKEKIVVVNGFGEQVWSTWKLSYLLNKYRVPMIGIQNNSGLGSILRKSNSVQAKKLTKASKIFKKIFFLCYLLMLRINLLSKYDTFFISGKKLIRIITKYKSKFNEVICVNSHVYDTFLEERKREEVSDDSIVFLDIAMPFMIDFKNWGMEPLDPDTYYRDLNHFFAEIESIMSKKVIICAHPQFSVNKKDIYFPDREVVWFKTNEYIAKSSLVLIHYTNAIQYAILHNKPILLLDDESLNSYIRSSMNYCEKNLGLLKIAYKSAHESGLKKIVDSMKVDKHKYDSFKNDYLVNEGDEDITSISKAIQVIKAKYKIA